MYQIDRLPQSIGAKLNIVLSRAANYTILYRHSSFILVTFGVFATVGSFLWMWITGACLLAHGLTRYQVTSFLFGGTFSALLFSRSFWWLGHARAMIRQPLFGIRNVGYVSWGGLAGLIVFFTTGFHWKRVGTW